MFDSIDPATTRIPRLDLDWANMSTEQAWEAYTTSGWPVHAEAYELFVVLGRESGLTAVHVPADVWGHIDGLAQGWAMANSESVVVLFAHPDAVVRTLDVTVMVEEAPLTATVLGDGSRVTLPGAGRSEWSWAASRNSLGGLPLFFRRAASRGSLLKPKRLGVVEDSSRVVVAGGLARKGEVTLVYGASGTGVSTILYGVMASAAASGSEAALLDYGLGDREVSRRLAAMGVNRDRVQYVPDANAFTHRSDLYHLATGRTDVLVVDDLPGLCHAAGTTDRLAERVVPHLRELQQLAAEKDVAVIVADKDGRGSRPRGAREKLDLAHTAWLLEPVERFAPGRSGMVRLVNVRDRAGEFTDQVVAVHAEDGLRVEWNCAEDVEEFRHRQTTERVLHHVRQVPRQVTKSQLSNLAELGGSRDLRRQVVEELEADGLLQVVAEPRSERGVTRTRRVYVAKEDG